MFNKLIPILGLQSMRPLFQKRSLVGLHISRKIRLPKQSKSLSTIFANLSEHLKSDDKKIHIQEVTVSSIETCIEVAWDSIEEKSKYPFLWLRDNCQCEMCFDQSAQSRKMRLDDLDLETRPISTSISDCQSNLQIEWSQGHRSIFSANWLKERSFDKKVQESRNQFSRLDKIFWGRESFHNIPTLRFEDILETDEGVLDWLRNLEIFGFLFITGAPASCGQVRKLAERIAFVRRTHYGEEFSVKAKVDPSNVAYSSGQLQLHADLPYYKYKPGTQLIHCIEQFRGNGGDSLVADAMNVAYHFKKEKPEQFHLLSNISVDWCDIGLEDGKEFYKVLQQPIICQDHKGEIERINFSQPQRDSFFNVSFDEVTRWYKAYKEFYIALNNPKYCLTFKMNPGTIQSFDNLRIVHGRTGYDANIGNREIEGCYIDWDEIKSRRRVLQLKIK